MFWVPKLNFKIAIIEYIGIVPITQFYSFYLKEFVRESNWVFFVSCSVFLFFLFVSVVVLKALCVWYCITLLSGHYLCHGVLL